MESLEQASLAPRAYPIARKSMPFLRGPPSSESTATSKPLVARQAADLAEKNRIIKDLQKQLQLSQSIIEDGVRKNETLERKVDELETTLGEVKTELGAQNRMVDFLRDQNNTLQGKLFDLQFKEPVAAPRHPGFTRTQGQTEVQWLLQLRGQGWYELEDLATTFAGEDRLGEGFTAKDYTAIIQSVNTKTVTVQHSANAPLRTFYFESPKDFVPSLPLYYKGKPVGVADEGKHVERLMALEGI
ncbi:hypothetical protein PVAG01_01018 [Phlyctema vagabunda]|uniref:Monopolin complex subunit Csm1/Pcs1 C-terminal domain-containing protein n=1 Tax=Phlyctema vagabunda TaxID=108571 RepID=A0ABR4PW60_9HELO